MMKIWYRYDESTFEYLWPVPLSADPLNPGKYFPIDNATPAEPLPEKEGFKSVQKNGVWEYIENYRGKTVYHKAGGQELQYVELGGLPDHLTHLQPVSQWDRWYEDQQVWIKDVEAEKQFYLDQVYQSLQQERVNHRSGGFAYQGYIIKARETDQGNIIAILTGYSEGVRAADAVVNWKIKTNIYLALNGKAEAVALATDMDQFVQALFKVEAMLSAEVGQMEIDALEAFDAQASFKAELDKLKP